MRSVASFDPSCCHSHSCAHLNIGSVADLYVSADCADRPKMIVCSRSLCNGRTISNLRLESFGISIFVVTFLAMTLRICALPMNASPMGYNAVVDRALAAKQGSNHSSLLNDDEHMSRGAHLSHEPEAYTLVSPYESDNITSSNYSRTVGTATINNNSSAINTTTNDLGTGHVQQLLLSLRDALQKILVVHDSPRYRRHANVSPSSSPLVGTILGTMETVRSVEYNDSLMTNESTFGNDSVNATTESPSQSLSPSVTNSSISTNATETSDNATGSSFVSGLNEAFHKMGVWIQQASDAIRSKFVDDKSTLGNSTQGMELNSTWRNSTDGVARIIWKNSSMVVARVDDGRLVSSSALKVSQQGAYALVEMAEDCGIRKYRIQIEDLRSYENGSSSITVDTPNVRLERLGSEPNDTGYDIVIPLLTHASQYALGSNRSTTREQTWSAHTEEDDVKFLQAQLECQHKFGASGLQRMLCTCESVHTVSLKRELLCVSRVADKAIRAAHHVGASSVGEEVYDGAVKCKEETKAATKLDCLIGVLEENIGRQTTFHAAHGRSILGHEDDESVDAVLSQWTLTLADLDGSDQDAEVGTGFGPGGSSLWPARLLMWTALIIVIAFAIARILHFCQSKCGISHRVRSFIRDFMVGSRCTVHQARIRKYHRQTNLV